jgi:hypothetical protein
MKSNKLFLLMAISSGFANAAEQTKGLRDSQWFYDENNPYAKANALHQERKWEDSEREYEQLLQQKIGDDYDQDNAQVGKAICRMAQRKQSEGWRGIDNLLNIEKDKQISEDMINNAQKAGKKSILVRGDNIGIGDYFHLIKLPGELKKRTDWDVTLLVPQFLKNPLSEAAHKYGFKIVGSKDDQPKTDHITHLFSLMGHLRMNPTSLGLDEAIFTAPGRAIDEVNKQIQPILAQGKTIGVVFLGEDRQATVPGGKKLPRNPKDHGRHLDSKPFMTLLENYPNLVLIDCGSKNSMVVVDENKKGRCIPVAPEKEPFDTIMALALAMNINKKMICLGADNGPTNVFARTLDPDAQRRMAIIIPNGKEYDMRMEGHGPVYTQMISDCRVYKCATPQNQTEVIEKAYQSMTT